MLEVPYVVRDDTNRLGYSGIAVTYLNLLQNNLQFSVTPLEWNSTFTALVDVMSTCSTNPNATIRCPCDIGVGSFTITRERVKKVTFLAPFSDVKHRMVSRLSNVEHGSYLGFRFIFCTFSLKVWLCIIIAIAMHAIGTLQYEPFNHMPPNGLQHDQPIPNGLISRCVNLCKSLLRRTVDFSMAVLFAYAEMLGQNLRDTRLGTAQFHRTAWLLLGFTSGLFLLTIYQASLTILLFETRDIADFRTLGDITDCIIPLDRVAMLEGGASQQLWNNAVNTSDVRQTCGWQDGGETVSNLTTGFSRLEDNDVDYFFTLEGSVLYWTNRNCKRFRLVGEPFFSTSVAFMMPKRSNQTLFNILSDETRRLREHNSISNANVIGSRNDCHENMNPSITMQHLSSFFVLYFVLWALLMLYRVKETRLETQG